MRFQHYIDQQMHKQASTFLTRIADLAQPVWISSMEKDVFVKISGEFMLVFSILKKTELPKKIIKAVKATHAWHFESSKSKSLLFCKKTNWKKLIYWKLGQHNIEEKCNNLLSNAICDTIMLKICKID